MAHKSNDRVITARPTSMYAERTAHGWQWETSVGTTYSVQWHRKRRTWVARRDGHGDVEVTSAPSIRQAIARWPSLAQAVFRRTLRPLGIMR